MTRPDLFKFRLFIAGDAANSSLALTNLRALCQANLPDQYEIEVVDVFREPRRALAEGVFLTPTVMKLAPPPLRRIVGTLTHTEMVLHSLGLETAIA
jgi:circadian clock protein KaiB